MTNNARKATIAERRAKAIQLRLAGMDWQSIADQMGYADRGAACKDVTRAMEMAARAALEGGEDLRQLEVARLDRLQTALWPAAIRGDVKAIDSLLRLMARRARLLGLDAPTRVELVAEQAAAQMAVVVEGVLALPELGLSAEQIAAARRGLAREVRALAGARPHRVIEIEMAKESR